MARVAIVVMIPIVAVLLWRDWVLEWQIRLLAFYDAALHHPEEERLVAARDEIIDEAMWDLLRGDPASTIDRVEEAARIEVAVAMPQRAMRLAAAASCRLGEKPPRWSYWQDDRRVRPFCAKK